MRITCKNIKTKSSAGVQYFDEKQEIFARMRYEFRHGLLANQIACSPNLLKDFERKIVFPTRLVIEPITRQKQSQT